MFKPDSEAEAQRLIAATLGRYIKTPLHRDASAKLACDLLNATFGAYKGPASRFGDATALRTDGFQFVDTGLPIFEIHRMREFFAGRRGAPDKEGRYYHPPADISDCPHAIEIVTSQDALTLAADYLGTRPTLALLNAWWTTIPDRLLDDQVFHRDTPDVRFCKMFVYLSDVTEDDGPHEFVLGSHRLEHVEQRLREAGVPETSIRVDAEHIFTNPRFDATPKVARYLQKDVRSIVGAAGSSFFEDTFALHRGKPPAPGRHRLILQALYSIGPDLGNYQTMLGFRDQRAWKERLPDTDLARFAVRHWL